MSNRELGHEDLSRLDSPLYVPCVSPTLDSRTITTRSTFWQLLFGFLRHRFGQCLFGDLARDGNGRGQAIAVLYDGNVVQEDHRSGVCRFEAFP